MDLKHIRNFSIIAHIDHGKSTLADRMLEITHTIPERKMREQVLDSMELERERGITIKMQPVRMIYHPRGLTQTYTQTNADSLRAQTNADYMQTNADKNADFLYEDITYKIRGATFAVKKVLGLGHKEIVYHKALEVEFKKIGLSFESEKIIDVKYGEKKVGTYVPDFIIEGKVLIELKALPEIGKPQEQQVWSYLKGCEYRLAFLVNFGSKDVTFKRIIYDSARNGSALVSVQSAQSQRDSEEYILNLIDTPGHIDFSYEVSRALKAVEGSILLIDSTQGVQAQTLTTLNMAREGGLKIIPVLSKIDSPLARVEEVKKEVIELLNCDSSEILLVSGRTGEGVENLLQEIVKRVPPPIESYKGDNILRAMVFDFKYSNHKGVIVFIRLLDGKVKKGDNLIFSVSGEKFISLEVGTFSPEETPREYLGAGDTGYIVTGIKRPGIASVGDTITKEKNPLPALSGYMQPMPVVWASVFPENADDFLELKMSLGKLKLSDSSFSYEEESSGSLGRGFRCGFLGMLHLEIITERLKREFNLKLVITTPSITYEVLMKNPSTHSGQVGKKIKIFSPYFFPDDGNIETVFEPWVKLKIITPIKYLGNIMQLLFDHEAEIGETENFGNLPNGQTGNRAIVQAKMPLRELMRNFFDELKSVSSGYGSISYEIDDMRIANVTRLDVIVADEVVPAFSRVVSKRRAEEEAEEIVEKLHNILPRQMFITKIQGKALGRIISSRTIQAFRKDVTQHMYGGDVTRKNKLRDKQKKGKKKMKERGKVNIPQDVFLRVMRSGK